MRLCCLRVQADGRAAAQLSEAAQSELLDICEEQFAQLEKVRVNPVCPKTFCLTIHIVLGGLG